MFDREKLFHLLTDANNPAWKWLPNNGETLKLVDYIISNYGVTTLDDGIYTELFAVKNGIRYNAKIVNMKEVSTTLTSSLMDGIEKLWSNR